MLLHVDGSGKSMVYLAARIPFPKHCLYVLSLEGPVFCAENNMKEEKGGRRGTGCRRLFSAQTDAHTLDVRARLTGMPATRDRCCRKDEFYMNKARLACISS